MRIALAEDNENSRRKFADFVERYQSSHAVSMELDIYKDGQELVDSYVAGYDVLFLDVEMPEMDGMKAARLIRNRDESVIIVFVTNMAKYAVKGYEVGALDYILKPMEYPNFEMHMDRVVRSLNSVDRARIQLKDRDEIYTLAISSIMYVSVENHRLHFYTTEKEVVVRGSIKEAEKLLEGHHFYLCNSGYLVNLKYVRSIIDGVAVVGNEKLPISRARKKGFVQALSDYMTQQLG